jgi:hypothetical protein
VAVLSGLGHGDRKNLAWLSLDHHESMDIKRNKEIRGN